MPANYYDDLGARLELDAELPGALRELGVLYDRDARGGRLAQLHTARVGGRVFFELLERRGGYAGYGVVELTRSHGRAARGRITRQLRRREPMAEVDVLDPNPRPPTKDASPARGGEERQLPAPPSLRRLLGPSVILGGRRRRLGRVHPVAVHQRQRGHRLPLAGGRRRHVQYFLNMEIERYTLATGETAIAGFARLWKPWGILFAFFAVSRTSGPAGRAAAS